jgi:superfamily II DNA or RNA helicase
MKSTLLENSPTLLYNNYKQGIKVGEKINQLLSQCDSFDFSIAFITTSGLAYLKQVLLDMERKGIKGRIITSTYLGFNSPKAFRELLKFKNIEVKIYEDNGFHPKGYIFKQNNLYNIIIGSTNLTQSALSINQEWNLMISSLLEEEIVNQINNEFEYQWNHSTLLTNNWINEYEKDYIKPTNNYKCQYNNKEIKPNLMQQKALESLETLRNENKDKALLISATGTGKTYLAAFDVKKYNPRKMLFVVHRRTIAKKAMESFQNIIPNKKMGLFSGNQRELDCDYIFSTIQTIHKKEYREMFKKTEFDYIIIDEVHKAGASSYQELIQYFKPEFLLGMSATPERSDNFDIYKLFDYNIAYEIRLQQAMEYDLLCPFHYYGITDLMIDNKTIDDKTTFNELISDKRVEYIITNIDRYGYSGDKVHGLIFCSRTDEAKELANALNKHGLNTKALTGENNEEERQNAMNSLESNEDGSLDYIITVDIFNEGIDIPKVNQVVMLRPTKSAIIFIQQLGRGLRKHEEKDYVVIIDFIGNYDNNYLIPIALSGNNSFNKDNYRKFMHERNTIIPGCSSVSFDEITTKRIYKSIDNAKFSAINTIKESYFELKAKLGRIPHLKEFEYYGAIDVQRIFQNSSLGSYHTFLKKYDDDYKIELTPLEEKYLQYISVKLSNGKRVQELIAIKIAIEKKVNLMNYLKEEMKETYDYLMPELSYDTIQNILSQNFLTGTGRDTYKDVTFIDDNGNCSQTFLKLLKNKNFYNEVIELLDYAIDLHNTKYLNKYKNTDFCLYEKYTYEDVCRLLNFEKNIVAQNMGGYKYNQRTNTLPVFINYNKEEGISDSINYNDYFIDNKHIIAMSKGNRRISSSEIQRFQYAEEFDTQIHLFIRKDKDDKESKEFYYLGLVYTQDIIETMGKDGKPICEIKYQLDQPVREDIYNYIVD